MVYVWVVLMSEGLSTFSIGDWIVALRETRPQELSIEVSTRCNLSCIHCFRYSSPNLVHVDMDYSDFKKIVDNAVESGVRRVVFTGWGEPTVNRSILDMLNYAKARGLSVAINTNGFNLAEIAGDLVKIGIDELYVSIDAFDVELYSRIRGFGDLSMVSKGLLEVNSLKNKLATKKPSIKAIFTITRINVNQVPLVVDYALSTGLEEVYLSYFIPHSSASTELDCYSSEECRAAFKRGVEEALSRLPNYPGFRIKLRIPGIGGYVQRSCPYVDNKALHVRVDGKVAPCLFIAYSWETRVEGVRRSIREYIIGDSLCKSLLDIWKRNAEMYFKHFFRLMPTCLDCELRSYCSYSTSTEYDCWGNEPNCAHCPYYYKLSYCPL